MHYVKKSVKFDSDKLDLEAALDKAGFGLYGFLLTCLTSLILISFTCIAYGSPFIVPTSACELKTTSSQQGMLASGTIISLLIGGVIWSYLADTRGRRAMLLIALLGASVLNIIATISVNWIMLLVFQVLAGVFAAGIYSVSMTLLSESIPMAYRNTSVLIVSSVMMLAQGIMALFAIPIIPLRFSHYLPSLGIYMNSWRTLMLVYSAPAVICAVCLFFMQESPKFIFNKKDDIKALEALRAIHRINNWRSKEEFQLKGLVKDESLQSTDNASVKDQILPLLQAPFLKYTIIMLFMNVGQQAMAIAFTMVAQYLGIVASIQILNWLLKVNCAAGFYFFGTLYISAAVAAFFLPDDRTLQPTEPTTTEVENSEKKT
ncbi:unnamed protein product [Arctia plantaginis]|uniref:Major facilitator superfamily (MFS) profile domain-containing protein n=1 Tax=Arctia plantaginis TaxID=874455 RepID=A0A8S1AN47_ARCPL|nr:unnamed protein product [Arctia plantaginis]